MTEAHHVEVSVTGPLGDGELDALCDAGYVGRLDDPAVLSRFIVGADLLGAIATAVREVAAVVGTDRIVAARAMTEAHWDDEQTRERFEWLEGPPVSDDLVRLRALADALVEGPFRGTREDRRWRMYGSDWAPVHDALDALEAPDTVRRGS